MGLQKYHTVTWPHMQNLNACNLLTPLASGVVGHKVTYKYVVELKQCVHTVCVHVEFQKCSTEDKGEHND